MKIIVTGAAGFIGSNVCDYLLKNNEHVIGIDNFTNNYDTQIKENNIAEARINKNFKFYQADITDQNKIERIFMEEAADAVIHLAATVGSRRSMFNPIKYYGINIIGTQNIIDACISSSISNIVMTSSSTIYKDTKDGVYIEGISKEEPKTPYGVTKFMNEYMAKVSCSSHNLNITMLRVFNCYGPRQRPELAIHKFVELIFNGKPIDIFNEDKSVRDYVFVYDCASAILRAIKTSSGYRLFNVGSGRGISLPVLVETISDVVGKKAVINKVPRPVGDNKGGVADITKAKQLLGFEPEYGLKKGIKNFYDWFLQKNE